MQHAVANVVPDSGVWKSDPPLFTEVASDRESHLLAALVREVGDVAPAQLLYVHVEEHPCRRHVPLPRAVRAHQSMLSMYPWGDVGVHVPMIGVGATHVGVVLHKVHLAPSPAIKVAALRWVRMSKSMSWLMSKMEAEEETRSPQWGSAGRQTHAEIAVARAGRRPLDPRS